MMDRVELVRQLRADQMTSRLRVVFSIAHDGEREARDLALSGGVSGLLTNPAASAAVLDR
jgi:CheY-like chemotaxis protein